MNCHTRLHSFKRSCPDIDPAVIEDFVDRMDEDYFRQFSHKTITDHLYLAGQLTPQQPCVMRIQKEEGELFELTILAYDYFSEFSTICGLLSAFGLNIREAFIFTSTEKKEPSISRGSANAKMPYGFPWRLRRQTHLSGLSRKKVVDVFRVQILQGFHFGRREQNLLGFELSRAIQLLHGNHLREARNRVNRLLVETLGKLRSSISTVIHPVQIHFNNYDAPYDTILDIRSTDTPAFLYTFANALTMRGIYVSKANIEVEGKRVRNRFFVRDRHGRKIQGRREQEDLTVAAAIIKEFTHFLTWAPDPAKALDHFDQLLDQLLPEKRSLSLLKNQPLLANLAQLFGSSDFLWEDFLRRQHTNLLPLLGEYQKGPLVPSKTAFQKKLQVCLTRCRGPAARKACLNQFKDEELFRIDMGHLLQNTPLPEFSRALTNLAEVIVTQALTEAQHIVKREMPAPLFSNRQPVPFAICGLGKLGGGELGYASDIEILFVYGSKSGKSESLSNNPSPYFERLVQEFLRWIEAKQEGIFHIDTRLRPHGEKGLLANSFEEIQTYYHPQGMAAPFERQALIKLRFIAGDAALGRSIERYRNRFVYSQEPWSLDTALHIRDRQRHELVPPNAIHVKYSPGGLIDVEYTIQYLQIIHGHTHPSLKTPNTLTAIHALQDTHLLSEKDASMLQDDYLFLRHLIDALRIVRGNAYDLILPPSGSDGMIFLARRLGFMKKDWNAAAAQLEKEIHVRMRRTHKIFTKLFKPAPRD